MSTTADKKQHLSSPTKPTTRPRRASKTLPLLIATTVSISACSDEPEENMTMVTDQYQSLEDCRADWGEDSTVCTTEAPQNTFATVGDANNTSNQYTSNGGGYHGSHYFGPTYVQGERDFARETIFRRYGSMGTGTHTYNSGTSGDHSVAKNFSQGVARGSFGGSHSSGGGSHSISRGGFGGSAHGFSGGG